MSLPSDLVDDGSPTSGGSTSSADDDRESAEDEEEARTVDGGRDAQRGPTGAPNSRQSGGGSPTDQGLGEADATNEQVEDESRSDVPEESRNEDRGPSGPPNSRQSGGGAPTDQGLGEADATNEQVDESATESDAPAEESSGSSETAETTGSSSEDRGTLDRFVEDTLNPAAESFNENVAEPVGEASATISPIAQGLDRAYGTDEFTESRQEFVSAGVNAANVPGAAAGGIRIGQRLVEDASRTASGQGDEVVDDLQEDATAAGSSFVNSAREDPLGTGASVLGGLAGGVVTGTAFSRGARAAGRGVRQADAPDLDVPTMDNRAQAQLTLSRQRNRDTETDDTSTVTEDRTTPTEDLRDVRSRQDGSPQIEMDLPDSDLRDIARSGGEPARTGPSPVRGDQASGSPGRSPTRSADPLDRSRRGADDALEQGQRLLDDGASGQTAGFSGLDGVGATVGGTAGATTGTAGTAGAVGGATDATAGTADSVAFTQGQAVEVTDAADGVTPAVLDQTAAQSTTATDSGLDITVGSTSTTDSTTDSTTTDDTTTDTTTTDTTSTETTTTDTTTTNTSTTDTTLDTSTTQTSATDTSSTRTARSGTNRFTPDSGGRRLRFEIETPLGNGDDGLSVSNPGLDDAEFTNPTQSLGEVDDALADDLGGFNGP